jgi:hypothetical protein
MSNFIDFNERLSKLRVDLMRATEALMKSDQPPFAEFDVEGEGLAISTAEGTQDIKTIFYENLSKVVCIKTTSGEVWDYSDLETDDMVAIYEHVYYQVYEKPLNDNYKTFNEAPYGDDE